MPSRARRVRWRRWRPLPGKIHVVEAGDAAQQHFGAGQAGAVRDKLVRRALADSAGQMCPCSQSISGRSSARPRISDIAACVCRLTRPGNQDVVLQHDPLVPDPKRSRAATRQDGDDPSVVDGDGMVPERHIRSTAAIQRGSISKSMNWRVVVMDNGV